MNLSTAIELYLLDCNVRRLRQRSIKLYEIVLTQFKKNTQLDRVEDITPTIIKHYSIYLQKYSVSYQRSTLTVIKAFVTYLGKDEIADIKIKIKLPAKENKIKQALTTTEIKQILCECRTKRDELLILFLLDTGIRASELIGIDIKDVDLVQGLVKIRQGKTGERFVSIGVKVRKLLIIYLSKIPDKNRPLFVSSYKQRFSRSGITGFFKRLAKRTNIAHCHAHTFRRTFAINCLRNGMNIHILARLMGHSDIQMLKWYLDIDTTDLKHQHSVASPVDNL